MFTVRDYEMFYVLLICFLVFLVRKDYFYSRFIYKSTSYFSSTGTPFSDMWYDSGKRGEFLLYLKLRCFERDSAKFIFNCYIPTKSGKTTEIDLIMIHQSGIYVFENKNFNGWIFGNPMQKTWTQTLPQGRGYEAHKEKFYNPIFQNKTHISLLETYLNYHNVIESIVVFSSRCTLKTMNPCIRDDFSLLYSNQVCSAVRDLIKSNKANLTNNEILNIYNTLFSLAKVSDVEKNKHINDIRRIYR